MSTTSRPPTFPTKFRKLTIEELARYGINIPSKSTSKYSNFRSFVTKYYGPAAFIATIGVNSEYNDCGYDHRLAYIVVCDEKNNELVPLKETATQCRKEWKTLIEEHSFNESREPVEDIVFYVTDKLPDLYLPVTE